MAKVPCCAYSLDAALHANAESMAEMRTDAIPLSGIDAKGDSGYCHDAPQRAGCLALNDRMCSELGKALECCKRPMALQALTLDSESTW